MTAPKKKPTRSAAPPGWYFLQDAANMLGIGPGTMTHWVASGFVRVQHPDGIHALVSAKEVQRVLRAMRKLGEENP